MKYILTLLFLFLCIFIFYEGLKKDPKKLPSNLIDSEIPKFEIPKYNKNINFTQEEILDDKEVKIINFFASWCPPCQVEHKQILELSNYFDVYGIAKKNKKIELDKWFSKFRNPYKTIGLDFDGMTSIDWGVYGLPETFIIDKNGLIIYKHVGPVLEKDIEIIKEKAFEEK